MPDRPRSTSTLHYAAQVIGGALLVTTCAFILADSQRPYIPTQELKPTVTDVGPTATPTATPHFVSLR